MGLPAAQRGPGLKQWGGKKFPPAAAPWPQAATVCHAALCPGGRDCEQVVRSGLWTPGLCGHGKWGLPCRRLHSDWPCLLEDEIHGALPSGGRIWNGHGRRGGGAPGP